MAEETTTVVTEREGMTSVRQLNSVIVVAMPPWKIALTRAVRVFGQSLVGSFTLVATGMSAVVTLGIKFSPHDIWTTVGYCLIAATFNAAASLIQNSAELWLKVDATNPTLRA